MTNVGNIAQNVDDYFIAMIKLTIVIKCFREYVIRTTKNLE